MMLETFCSSLLSFSTCSVFLAFETAIFVSLQIFLDVGRTLMSASHYHHASKSLKQLRTRFRCRQWRTRVSAPHFLDLGRRLNRSGIHDDPRAHGRTQETALDVFALSDRRLGFDHTGDQGQSVVDELVGSE